jgi:hypothetical protein
MYLPGLQVRRERTGRHAPSTKEGPSLSRKKRNKGASTVDRNEERLSDERKKVPLDEIVVWTSLGPLPRWVPGPTTWWVSHPEISNFRM